MAAYVIADTNISDHKTYDEYKRQVARLSRNLEDDSWSEAESM